MIMWGPLIILYGCRDARSTGLGHDYIESRQARNVVDGLKFDLESLKYA